MKATPVLCLAVAILGLASCSSAPPPQDTPFVPVLSIDYPRQGSVVCADVNFTGEIQARGHAPPNTFVQEDVAFLPDHKVEVGSDGSWQMLVVVSLGVDENHLRFHLAGDEDQSAEVDFKVEHYSNPGGCS